MLSRILPALLLLSCLAGCAYNRATPPESVPAAYSYTPEYEDYDCERLGQMLHDLSLREAELAEAQRKRASSDSVWSFFRGYGEGDGETADELARVRGDRDNVLRVMEGKQCPGIVEEPLPESLPAQDQGAEESAAPAAADATETVHEGSTAAAAEVAPGAAAESPAPAGTEGAPAGTEAAPAPAPVRLNGSPAANVQ